ncbi:MAG: DUF2703 domain-containing protein [Methanoregulaceae archaeon]|nr:DUF2703 domain-containing protein [Methanoregulaceae archaeon]
MERTLTVLWRHTRDQEQPCLKCLDTGRTLPELLEVLLPAFSQEGIILDFKDEVIPPGAGLPENVVLFNGIPVSSLLSFAAQGEEYCHASKCQPSEHIHRHYRDASGVMCDEAPEILVRKAILLSLDQGTQAGFADFR